MNEEKLIELFNQIIRESKNIEEGFRGELNKSVDIEDFQESQKAQLIAFKKVRKYKKLRESMGDILEFIKDENIEEDYIGDKKEGLKKILEESRPEKKSVAPERKKPILKEIVQDEVESQDNIDDDEDIYIKPEIIKNIENNKSNYKEKNNNKTISKKNKPNNKKIDTIGTPSRLTILGSSFPVSSWNEVILKVCEVMILRRPYIFSKFNNEESLNRNDNTNFSYIQSEIDGQGMPLPNGMFVRINIGSEESLYIVKKIISICEFNEEDLIIEYK